MCLYSLLSTLCSLLSTLFGKGLVLATRARRAGAARPLRGSTWGGGAKGGTASFRRETPAPEWVLNRNFYYLPETTCATAPQMRHSSPRSAQAGNIVRSWELAMVVGVGLPVTRTTTGHADPLPDLGACSGDAFRIIGRRQHSHDSE